MRWCEDLVGEEMWDGRGMGGGEGGDNAGDGMGWDGMGYAVRMHSG